MTKLGQELDTKRVGVDKHLIPVRQKHEGKLATDGLDVDATISELNRELAYLEKLTLCARRVKKRYQKACAAIAQTDTEYFHIMCKLLDPLVEICPEHPLIRQWTRVRPMWAEQLLSAN